jgi:hypothetical protein
VIGLQDLTRLPRRIEEPTVARFKSTAAPAAAERGEVMGEMKRELREAGADVKEAWRKADGDESLGDKVANTADRIENEVKNAGDDLHEKVDEASRDAAYEQGRQDEMSRR